MVPQGIQKATSGIIGNCIGANNIPLAQRFFKIISLFTLAVLIFLSILLVSAREQIVGFYTKEAEIQAICERGFLLIAISCLFNGLEGYLQGPIRAMGLQQVASYFTLACYYLIGIPASCLLGFWAGYGVLGIQSGFMIALIVQSIAYLGILRAKNWQDVADEAQERIKAAERDINSTRSDDCYAKAV